MSGGNTSHRGHKVISNNVKCYQNICSNSKEPNTIVVLFISLYGCR